MSEYDETQLFPDLRLVRLLLERLGKNSLSVSVEVAAEKILDAQRSLEAKDAEIAKLKATIADREAEIENYKIQISDINASLRPIKNNVDLILKDTTHD